MEVYEIVKSIGSGSFGQVYLARHKREDKSYVIKKIKIKDMPQKDKENTEQEVRNPINDSNKNQRNFHIFLTFIQKI